MDRREFDRVHRLRGPELLLADRTLIVVTLGIGTLAFLLPDAATGPHRRLRAAKEAELERVRTAIERARGELLEGSLELPWDRADAGPPRLRAAHRRRPEWPLDTPQVTRFGLVVALGLGSWVGGAVIERVLDAFGDHDTLPQSSRPK